MSRRITHTKDSLELVEFLESFIENEWTPFHPTERTWKAVERAELLGKIEVNREAKEIRLKE